MDNETKEELSKVIIAFKQLGANSQEEAYQKIWDGLRSGFPPPLDISKEIGIKMAISLLIGEDNPHKIIGPGLLSGAIDKEDFIVIYDKLREYQLAKLAASADN